VSYEDLIPPLYPSRAWMLAGEYGPRKMIAADIGLCEPVTVWAVGVPYDWDSSTTLYRLDRVFWSGGGEGTAWPTPDASHYKSERVYDGIRKEKKRRKR
jgi:hypothetical protein